MGLDDFQKQRFALGQMTDSEKVELLTHVTQSDTALEDLLDTVESQVDLLETPQGFKEGLLKPKSDTKSEIKVFNLKVICAMVATFVMLLSTTALLTADIGGVPLLGEDSIAHQLYEDLTENFSNFTFNKGGNSYDNQA